MAFKGNLSEREEWLGKEIVDAAFRVHRELGPGLLEKVYEACFCYELTKKGIAHKRQADLPIIYDNQLLDENLRIDVYVDELVVCELKSVLELHPVWTCQVLSHLKLTKRRLGYLINFNEVLIKDGIHRFIL